MTLLQQLKDAGKECEDRGFRFGSLKASRGIQINQNGLVFRSTIFLDNGPALTGMKFIGWNEIEHAEFHVGKQMFDDIEADLADRINREFPVSGKA